MEFGKCPVCGFHLKTRVDDTEKYCCVDCGQLMLDLTQEPE